ncbi:MAG: FTR1 family protein [Clostridia bacterium]|nr:FTR1 family protein [Clostridia bacterium]
MLWQAVTAGGNPDPTDPSLSPFAAILDTGILVFREGLEAILVLAAITASLVRRRPEFWRPVGFGAGLAFAATLVTWLIVVAIISGIHAPELDIQAATGLLAIVVLLIVMNWFFHRVYFTGWMSYHGRKQREVVQAAGGNVGLAFKGLALLGFSAVYREGFEIVLFLQSVRLRVGIEAVLYGTLIGLALTAIVAVLTFVAHRRLPYQSMLVFTGIMLGVVLLVMVGESVQEMQLAGWVPSTDLSIPIPAWLGVWLAIFPTAESLTTQALAALFVIGSFVITEFRKRQAVRGADA